jgi:hypothetical protein
MSDVSRWRDSGHLERAVQTAGGQQAFDTAVATMLDDARGWRLAEMRKRRGMTQEQVATLMSVSVARISQIESGDVSLADFIPRTRHSTATSIDGQGRRSSGAAQHATAEHEQAAAAQRLRHFRGIRSEGRPPCRPRPR